MHRALVTVLFSLPAFTDTQHSNNQIAGNMVRLVMRKRREWNTSGNAYKSKSNLTHRTVWLYNLVFLVIADSKLGYAKIGVTDEGSVKD